MRLRSAARATVLAWVALCGATGGCGRVGFDPDAADQADAGEVAIDAPLARYCQVLGVLDDAPQIDGMNGEGVTVQPIVPEGWFESDEAQGAVPAGHGAVYAAAVTGRSLWLYVRVENPVRVPPSAEEHVYCGDGVELYVDGDGSYASDAVLPNYDDNTMQFVLGAPGPDEPVATRATRYYDTESLGAWTGSFAVVATEGGFAVEAEVVAADLQLASWDPAADGIGFNLAHNVSYDDGTTDADVCPTRRGQYFLRALPREPLRDGLPFLNTQSFCTAAVE